MFNFKNFSLYKIILILILFVSLFFRLYEIDKSVWLQFGYDESRDMLVASHIISGERVSRGPLAAGGFNKLDNSPVYYYFVALIWFFVRTPIIFMYFWAVIMSLPILMGYFIGKKLIDEKMGLIFASLLAINKVMIYSSRELLQPHLLLIFSMGFILSAILFIKGKKNKLRNLILMIFFTMISLHFHYGIIFVLPAALLYIGYCWFSINPGNKKTSFKNLFSPPLVFSGLLFSWIMLTYKRLPFDQLDFFVFNFQKNYNSSFISQLSAVYISLNKMIWGSYLVKFGSILSSISLAVLLSSLLDNSKNRVKIKKLKEILTFLFLIISSIFLLGFYQWNVSQTYMLFLLPFFILLVSLALRLAIKRLNLFGWFLTFLMMFFTASSSIKNTFDYLPTISYHDQQKETARRIFDHHSALSREDDRFLEPNLLVAWYTPSRHMPFDGWATSGAWYYLEKYFDKNLIKITNYGANHTPLNKYPKIIYMVCDHRESPELVQQECVDNFINLHQLNKDELESLSCGQNLSTWSIKINSTEQIPIINLVNYDQLND